MDSKIPSLQELQNLKIDSLGSPQIRSPFDEKEDWYIDDDAKVLADAKSPKNTAAFEIAGPRKKIFFYSDKITCGIVTCGGLCPGVNNVIRSIVMTLKHQYKVKKVLGFCYGYQGLTASPWRSPIELTLETVEDIHNQGGTMLGSSRGQQDIKEMVDILKTNKISILFIIGGDGTFKGGYNLVQEIKDQELDISIIGIPKTIDNDIYGTEKTFGLTTAVELAEKAISCAHTEAESAWNGIGIVKLMGRDSGFIAAYATLANNDVNFCLVPEAPVTLKGEDGFLKALEQRLIKKRHAVIVAAEGAGQNLFKEKKKQKDASGNLLHKDIGLLLKEKIEDYFSLKKMPITLKYIDPSYTIRSVPANAEDAIFCLMLAQNAVHAGMSGRTNMFVGFWNQYFTHVPFHLALNKRKKIDTKSTLWQTIAECTF